MDEILCLCYLCLEVHGWWGDGHRRGKRLEVCRLGSIGRGSAWRSAAGEGTGSASAIGSWGSPAREERAPLGHVEAWLTLSRRGGAARPRPSWRRGAGYPVDGRRRRATSRSAGEGPRSAVVEARRTSLAAAGTPSAMARLPCSGHGDGVGLPCVGLGRRKTRAWKKQTRGKNR
jgi:hypothetical protein